MIARAYEVHEPDILSQRASELVAWIIEDAVQARGEAHVAISGGSTPRPLFKLLASPPWQERIPWAHTHIWWVDERCVPPDHPHSNYGVAYALMLQHLPVIIPHRIHGELTPPEAAAAYEHELKTTLHLGPEQWPRFDLILLGMGEDGHTASLFPGDSALDVRDRLVTVGRAPSPPRERVTLTLPVLNQAAHILFLVAGENKAPALQRIFHQEEAHPLPAALVEPESGRLLWLLDINAARGAGLDYFPVPTENSQSAAVPETIAPHHQPPDIPSHSPRTP
jgi:6-phosphogluconolactonase